MEGKFDGFGRKVWDREFYSKSKEERDKLRGLNTESDCTNQSAKSYSIDEIRKKRESYLDLSRATRGKNATSAQNDTIGGNTDDAKFLEKGDTGGYWCELCKQLFNDSHSWVNHINSLKHNQKMGTSLFVERKSLEEVRQHLEELIDKYDENGKLIERKDESKNQQFNGIYDNYSEGEDAINDESSQLAKYDFPVNFK